VVVVVGSVRGRPRLHQDRNLQCVGFLSEGGAAKEELDSRNKKQRVRLTLDGTKKGGFWEWVGGQVGGRDAH